MIDTPEKLSNSFFAMNSVFVQKQFERTSHEAFSHARIQHYCRDLQWEIDTLAQISDLALTMKQPFSTLYKQQVRLRNSLALAKEMTPICNKTYEVTKIKTSLDRLNLLITPQSFLLYKNSVCQKPNPSTHLSIPECQSLPLSPYSIRWLEAAGGRK